MIDFTRFEREQVFEAAARAVQSYRLDAPGTFELARTCSHCHMEESACICSTYDSEGNEL